MSDSVKIFPATLSTANIPPGDILPLVSIFDAGTGFTPVSEAIVTVPSFSIWYLDGRIPFLSRKLNAYLLFARAMPAGPSHASICIELYS